MFNVEYARGGSLQMIMTTKSGTDTFHGQASDYFTNQHVWAGTEFVHSYAPFHSNNISANIGGPIVPHHQVFFFFAIEPLRASSSTGGASHTFEDPAFVSFAKAKFPNTLGTQLLASLPPSHATVTGVAQTAATVVPGTCGTAVTSFLPCGLPMIDNGVFNATNYRNGTQYEVRADKYFQNDRVYGNYYRTVLDTGGDAIRPGLETTNHYITQGAQVNETHRFSPTTLNEAAFSFLRVEGISPQTGDFKIPVVNVTGQSVGLGDGLRSGISSSTAITGGMF